MMTSDHSPTVRHRRLAAELRRLRESAGLSPDLAAAALGWSRPKLVKFETARNAPGPADVAAMVELYGAPEVYKIALIQLSRDVRKRGWWTAYDDVLPPSYAELEDDAVEIRSWQVQEIPSLLQTDEYALAIIRLTDPDAGEESQLRRLQARMARRTVLTRHSAPTLRAVVDESSLRRPIGGRDAMRRQLTALLEAAERPHVHLQVAPTGQSDFPGMEGSFVILSFASPIALDVAYIKNVVGGIFIEDVEQVRRCGDKFDRICAAALPETESAALIEAIADGFAGDSPTEMRVTETPVTETPVTETPVTGIPAPGIHDRSGAAATDR
ncbi:MAG TPA: helix-turn-helix transcriptional regulator [Streptosporangiaceae bacterium]